MSVDSGSPSSLHALPAFSDNYVWALAADEGGGALVVDPGDAEVVVRWLRSRHRRLSAILVTHHHPDHTGGIVALRSATGARVYGPRHETIAGIDSMVGDGDLLALAGFTHPVHVLDVPGHTRGHVAYAAVSGKRRLLFCGDTLFSAGCGRLFEGSPADMHASLRRLAALSPDTIVCCAHEYTLGNLRFAAAVEPGNPAIAAAIARAQALREGGHPTLPTTLADELAVNPFLRTDAPEVVAAARARLGRDPADGTEVFATLRCWKDTFR